MRQWFGDAVDKESNSYASGKNHGKVGSRVEFGRFILLAEFNVSVLVGHEHEKEEKESSGSHKQPRKVEGDVGPPSSQDFVGSLGIG